MTELTHVEKLLDSHAALLAHVKRDCAVQIADSARVLIRALDNGGTVFVCGNGGSAADSQHFAAELVGRFVIRDRRSLPAIALTVDTSALTAIANDYGYERVFARQIEGLARAGDVLVGITTSGRSPNIIAAMEQAGKLGVACIALVGSGASAVAPHCAAVVSIPHKETARIQEMHITVIHAWCELIDQHFGTTPR